MNIGNFPDFNKNNIEKTSGFSEKKPEAHSSFDIKKDSDVQKTPLGAASYGVLINNPEKVQSVEQKKEEPTKEEKKSFLKQSEITPAFAEKISNIAGEHWKRAVNLINDGYVSDALIECYAKIKDEDIYSCANDLLTLGFRDNQIYPITGKEDFYEKFATYKNLYEKGYDTEIIPEISEVKESGLQNIDRLIKRFKDSPDYAPEKLFGISSFANADETVMQRAEELIALKVDDMFAANEIATSDEVTYKKDIALLKKGYEPAFLNKVAELKGERAQKAEKLVQNYGMINFHAVMYSDYYDNIYSRISEIKNIDKYNEIHNAEYENILKLDEENYVELKKLLEEGYDYNTYFDKNSLKDGIKKYGEESRNNARIWRNFIEKSPNGEKYMKELTPKDVFFLKHNAFDSEYYTPEEYTDAFIYLKNIKTENGTNIAECSKFYDKRPDDAKLQKLRSPLFYNNIKQILSINPGSVDASYIQTFLELIQEGAIHPAAIRKLSPDNSLKLSEHNIDADSGYTVTMSDDMKSDIDVLYATIIKNEGKTKEEIDKLITDNYVKTYTDEKEADAHTKIGDVCMIEGEKYIGIKNADNKIERLKLTKETYTKLFPPYDRFATGQQTFGDCFCIETLMNMYSCDEGRALLLKSFEEDNDGNITVKTGNYPGVKFEHGEFPKYENEDNYSSGAKGFKLLEYAYSEALVRDEINSALNKLSGDEKKDFQKFIDKHPHNFFIYNKNEKPVVMTFSDAIKTGAYKRAGNIYRPNAERYESFNSQLIGNGGFEYNVLKKFGLNSRIYYTGSDKKLAYVPKKDFEKNAVEKGIDTKNFSRKTDINEFLNTPGLFENNIIQIGISAHAYGLEKKEDGFYISNPHNQGFPVKVKSLSELKEKGMLSEITITPKSEFSKSAA